MEALARISVFVKMSAVEKTQPVAVVGEVRGYPIQNHSNAALVQMINETHEILRQQARPGIHSAGRGDTEPDRGAISDRAGQRAGLPRDSDPQRAAGRGEVVPGR